MPCQRTRGWWLAWRSGNLLIWAGIAAAAPVDAMYETCRNAEVSPPSRCTSAQVSGGDMGPDIEAVALVRASELG